MTASRRTPDVLCVGETMALVTPRSAEPIASAHDFQLEIGGAESNVAMHLAGLGVTSAWFSALGDDPLGQRILRRVGEAGVDVHEVVIDPDARTGLYVKDPGGDVYYYRAGSAASRMSERMLPLPLASAAKIVHVSGITAALSPECEAFLRALMLQARSDGVRVSFDVNHRPALWPDVPTAAASLQEFAQLADIVFVGRDEADRLWQTATAGEIRAFLPGATHLVVKDGAVGATEFAAEGEVFVATPPVEVVEEVGAGDAFAAGWLAAFLRGSDAHDRLLRGHEQAARALTSTGDVPAASDLV